MEKNIQIGDTVFVRVVDRIDAFSHKRYTNPGAEIFRSVYVGGEVTSIEEDGNTFSMKLCNNNNFERDDHTYFFSFGNVLVNEVPSEMRGIYQYADGNGKKLIKTDTGFEEAV